MLQGADTFTGQNVALLTRVDPLVDLQRTEARVEYPVEGSTCFGSSTISTDKPTPKKAKGVSKHFFTRFAVAGLARPITMVALHFLARPDDPRRRARRKPVCSRPSCGTPWRRWATM